MDRILPLPAVPGREPSSVMDRALAWRDRLVATTAFQQWAARFPLTRFVARRRAAALFDLCAGFVYSQVLKACVELNVFELLRQTPLTIEALAARTAMPFAELERLVGAAISLRLLERRSNDRVGLGALGAPLVGNEALLALVAHHGLLYDDLRDPVALLRRRSTMDTALARYYPYAAEASAPSETAVAPYSALMSATASPLIAEVLDAYSFAGHQVVMDVGGGEGRFARALSSRWSHLNVQVFDLPPVAERARRASIGMEGECRFSAIGGDFRSSPLPLGADAITLIRVLLDHDDDTVLTLLSRTRSALGTGGKLLIAEPMAGVKGARMVGDAYFALYLYAMGSGRARSAAELSQFCRRAGFSRVRSVPTRYPLSTSILVAEV